MLHTSRILPITPTQKECIIKRYCRVATDVRVMQHIFKGLYMDYLTPTFKVIGRNGKVRWHNDNKVYFTLRDYYKRFNTPSLNG